MAVDHYENFPVASLLLPRHLRTPVQNIYRYARSADDIADEGNAQASERLEQLAQYQAALAHIRSGKTDLPGGQSIRAVFEPLADTIQKHELPFEPFFDLLSAFEQDVSTVSYRNDAELFDYCRRSANPVGRLMLHLYQRVSAENFRDADAICTGLQLTNFWQDVAIDLEKGRVYIPQDKLDHFQVDLRHIADTARLSISASPKPQQIAAWQAMMQVQVQQARELLLLGLPLTGRLPRRIGFELKLVVLGGLRILERLDQLHYDIFLHRPTLRKSDWILLLWRALG